MDRRSFIQSLSGAGIAVPLSQYLAIAKPFDASEGMLLEASFDVGDQVMMIFPEEEINAWYVLILKPNGQRIRLYPGEKLKKFWVYTEPIRVGSKFDKHGSEWAVYDSGEMVFAFRYCDRLIRTQRIETADPARFRVGSVNDWASVEGKSGYEIAWGDRSQSGIMSPAPGAVLPYIGTNKDIEIDWSGAKGKFDKL